jgi:hypothetical protein
MFPDGDSSFLCAFAASREIFFCPMSKSPGSIRRLIGNQTWFPTDNPIPKNKNDDES